jgi:hypothetical protein
LTIWLAVLRLADPLLARFPQAPGRAFEFWQIVVDGGLDHRVVYVEVAVSQLIAHTRDLGPRDGGLGIEHLSGQGLHRFTDFQQSDMDGVEYQAIG